MAIIDTINNGAFAHWLAKSNSYKNNFSYEGANALQTYLEDLSDGLGENIEFDPIAWCCEYSEYKNLQEIKDNYENIGTLEQLEEYTVVIKFDGGIIIQDF